MSGPKLTIDTDLVRRLKAGRRFANISTSMKRPGHVAAAGRCGRRWSPLPDTTPTRPRPKDPGAWSMKCWPTMRTSPD